MRLEHGPREDVEQRGERHDDRHLEQDPPHADGARKNAARSAATVAAVHSTAAIAFSESFAR